MYSALVHLGAVRVGVAIYAAALCVSTSALSQPLSESLEVVGTGVCPPPEAVRAAIFQLTSAERRRALPPESRVVVTDEGASYRVSVNGEGTTAQKKYTDPARECSRRTRFAAVFAILTLMPPELEPEPEPARNAQPAPAESGAAGAASGESPGSASKAPARAAARNTQLDTPEGDGSSEGVQGASASPPGEWAAPRARSLLRIEAVGLGERGLGSGSEPRVTSLGGELRALLGRGELAPTLAVSYAPAAELETGRAALEVRRIQASIGVRARRDFAWFDLGAELALVGGFERIRGLGLENPAQGNGFELGLRAAAVLSTAARVGPLVALHASVFPAPNTFEALPQGEVGHMPHLWLGLAAGAFLGL